MKTGSYSDGKEVINAAFFWAKVLVEICCFVCVCVLCSISRKNPFESHYIGNLTDYFINEENDITPLTNYSSSDNLALIKITKKGYRLNDSEHISSVQNVETKPTVRRLSSDAFCSEMLDYFKKYKGRKLSSIFDLKYDKIFHISIANLVISCFLLIVSIGNICYILNYSYKIAIALPLGLFVLLLYVARFILSIVLFYFMEKGDIEKYDDFLECKIVKPKYFKKFSDIHHIRNCFFAFLVFNIMVQGIEKVEKCFEYAEKYK